MQTFSYINPDVVLKLLKSLHAGDLCIGDTLIQSAYNL